jgi:demethylmenaquinone methyltransferase/2-methoxy-6-polyprenyl-1,4-benzoquinol methylase
MGRRPIRRWYYDWFSRVYDRFVAWHTGELTGPMRRALAARATHPPVRRALDLCCGTGAVTRAVADLVPAGALVVGLDFSGGMLARGVAGARRDALPWIRWVQADASALPFKGAVFDVVTCAYAVYELKGDARSHMLEEVARTLAPGGRFLLMEHALPTRALPRLLLALRSALIGAGGTAEQVKRELTERCRGFSEIDAEVLPPGKSTILTARTDARTPESRQEGSPP